MKNKVVFLDRDGVINRFPGMGFYVTSAKEFSLLPGSLEAIRLLSQAGYKIYVISNQGCVARKLITKKDLHALTKQFCAAAQAKGGKLTPRQVFYCYHQQSDGCACKKPKVLLFKRAIKGQKVDLKKTYFVGDSREDMEAAETLGCGKLLVLSGRNKRKDVKHLGVKPDVIKKNLLEAAKWIIKQKS